MSGSFVHVACLFLSISSFNLLIPLSAAHVWIKGRKLVRNGHAVHLKGVCWNPVASGDTENERGGVNYRGYVTADARAMTMAGINAVRTYHPILDHDVLDILWAHNISVLMTIFMNAKEENLGVIQERVAAVKDHPAILMWLVGNEWNYNGFYAHLSLEKSVKLLRHAVELIKQTDTTHPVGTVYGGLPSNATLERLPQIDIWGINKYHKLSFDDIFVKWRSVSQVPMFLAEYGADSYDDWHHAENHEAQGQAITVLTKMIMQESSLKGGVCVGGFVFELADEYWKDGAGDPNVQDTGGPSFAGGGPFPDMTFNEEYWGLLSIDGYPRKAFYAYAQIPVPGGHYRKGIRSQWFTFRKAACGAHPACAGELGQCCPGHGGINQTCCSGGFASASPTLEGAQYVENPMVTRELLPNPVSGGFSFRHKFAQQTGMFAGITFPPIAETGCGGVVECQFEGHFDALDFCEHREECTVVLRHPHEDGCDGGYGCYTPRAGELSMNRTWQKAGGRSWVKSLVTGSDSSFTRSFYT